MQGRDPYPYPQDEYLERSLAGIRWFVDHGCDCDEGLSAIERAVRWYLNSPERQRFLAALTKLLAKQDKE